MNNLMSIAQSGIKQFFRFTSENSPTILTGISVASAISAAIMAARGGIKAERILQAEEAQRISDWVSDTGQDPTEYPNEEVLALADKFYLTWRCYAPAVVMTTVSAVAAIASNSINLQRNAALAALYSLTDVALKEYQSQVVETLGEKADVKVRDALAAKHIAENPVNNCEVIMTGNGDVLFYDDLSGRYFRSTMQAVQKAQNDFNYQMNERWNFMTLNQWYHMLGLAPVAQGDYEGWNRSHGLLDIHFTARKTDDEQNTCMVIGYKLLPHRE